MHVKDAVGTEQNVTL